MFNILYTSSSLVQQLAKFQNFSVFLGKKERIKTEESEIVWEEPWEEPTETEGK